MWRLQWRRSPHRYYHQQQHDLIDVREVHPAVSAVHRCATKRSWMWALQSTVSATRQKKAILQNPHCHGPLPFLSFSFSNEQKMKISFETNLLSVVCSHTHTQYFIKPAPRMIIILAMLVVDVWFVVCCCCVRRMRRGG